MVLGHMLAAWIMFRSLKGRLWLRSLRPLVRFVTGRQNFPLILLLCLYINLQLTVNEYYIQGLRTREGQLPLENRSLSDFIGTQCSSGDMKEGKRNRRGQFNLKQCVFCQNASRLTVRKDLRVLLCSFCSMHYCIVMSFVADANAGIGRIPARVHHHKADGRL